MKELGRLLREKRESKGLSVDDLYQRTRIRQRVIEAIESGRFDEVPGGEVYARGFIRTMCEELGINYQEVAAQWPPTTTLAKLTPVVTRTKTSRINWLSTAGALIMVLLLVCAGIYYVYWWPRSETPSVNPVLDPPQVVSQPDPPPSPPSEQPKPAYTLIKQEGSRDLYAVEKWPMELTIKVLQDQCWVSVTVDRTQTSSATLVAGQEKTYQANSLIDMRLGKARVVEIKVNGQALPGQTGDVRDYTFTKTGP